MAEQPDNFKDIHGRIVDDLTRRNTWDARQSLDSFEVRGVTDEDIIKNFEK